MTASQFTHAELRAALTLMLDGPVQSGSLDAAVDTALAIFAQALEFESVFVLRRQGGDAGLARHLLFMADALAEPTEPEQQDDAEQDGAGE